jgi:hypothetical protein
MNLGLSGPLKGQVLARARLYHERLGCGGLTYRRILDGQLPGTLGSQVKDLFYPAHFVLERSIFPLQLLSPLFLRVKLPQEFLLVGIGLLRVIVLDLLLEVLEGLEELCVGVAESRLDVLVLIEQCAYLRPKHLILLFQGLATTSL